MNKHVPSTQLPSPPKATCELNEDEGYLGGEVQLLQLPAEIHPRLAMKLLAMLARYKKINSLSASPMTITRRKNHLKNDDQPQ